MVLAGHPRLKTSLERPAVDDIGSRATSFELEGMRQEKPRDIGWLITQCAAPNTEIDRIVTADAWARVADRRTTPLPIEIAGWDAYHHVLANAASRLGRKPHFAE